MPQQLKCTRCGHQWWPRDPTKKPGTCPACCSPYWHTPRGQLKSGPRKVQRKAQGARKPD